MTAFQTFIEEKIKLPSPPVVAINILTAVSKEETTFEDLAEIIKADPALTVRILKIANSSLYGIPKKIDSLQQATSLLGINTIQNIALSFVIVEKFQDTPQGGFDLEHFWQRAVSTAVAAEVLAKNSNFSSKNIFVTGLLQDIGTLILFLSDAVCFTSVLDEKRVNDTSLCQAEKNAFGLDHTEIGAHLLESWNLPETIYEPIRYHHTENIPKSSHSDAAVILSHAGIIASIYHGNQSNRMSIKARETLKSIYNYDEEAAAELIDEIGEKSREMLTLFSLDPGEVKPFSQIMQEANDELHRLNFSYEQVVLELKQAKQSAEQMASELKLANIKLRELAFRDDLTGLYNHRFFQEMLTKEIERSIRYEHPLSLLFLDIDFFKSINDTYGHPIGDHVLRETSKKMLELIRKNDVVARYGGEEFAIIMPEVGKSGAKVLAQRLRRGIEQNIITIGNKEISITTSIGLASTDMPAMELSRTHLIAQSDAALYKAKRNGRNRVES